MVALMGPSSSTWAPVGAMKRPSEVPPVVDRVGLDAGLGLDGVAGGVWTSSPRGQEGQAGQAPVELVVEVEAVAVEDGLDALLDGLRRQLGGEAPG
jgi:hypothetical protein